VTEPERQRLSWYTAPGWRLDVGSFGRGARRRGIDHVAVDLPTADAGVDPTLDAHADAVHVRTVLDGRRPVASLRQLLWRVVITEASAGHPKVNRLVYLAAFMPDTEDEFLSFMLANSTPEFATGATFGDDGLIRFDPDMVKKLAFQQATSEVASWAAGQLRPMAMGGGGSPTMTGIGWKTIPSTYVVCAEDQSLLPGAQRAGRQSAPPTVSSCPSTTAPPVAPGRDRRSHSQAGDDARTVGAGRRLTAQDPETSHRSSRRRVSGLWSAPSPPLQVCAHRPTPAAPHGGAASHQAISAIPKMTRPPPRMPSVLTPAPCGERQGARRRRND